MKPVSFVIVSHSGNLAKGVVEIAQEMAPEVTLLPAGGTDDDGIGTSYTRVETMVKQALEASDHVVLLSDLGSAGMLADMVAEQFDNAHHVQTPVVQGAVAGAVAAQGGAGVEQVIAATQQQEIEVQPPAEVISKELTVKNSLGLHARPAAMIARIAADHDANVTLNGVDGASVLALMGLALPSGAQVMLEASGPQAQELLDALTSEFENAFGED